MAAAAIGAAGSYMAASEQSKAAREAAAAQERIARENLAFQRDVYNQNVARMDPWVQYGSEQRNALAELMPSLTAKYDMAKYQAGPEYQNIMAQTDRERNALMAKSAAGGMYGSGTMANQLQQNAGYLASQGYQQGLQNYMGQNRSIYDMLNTGSNVGLQAAGQQGTYGTNLASGVGDALTSIGATQAGSQTTQGQARAAGWSGSANIGMNYLAQRDQYNQLKDILGAKQGNTYAPQRPTNLFEDISSTWNSFTDYFTPRQTPQQGYGMSGGLLSTGII